MKQSTSTAVARIVPPASDGRAEKVAPITRIAIPAALLLAAESVSARQGGAYPVQEGVYIHAKGNKGRIVGTDGPRMFLASFPLDKNGGPIPPWLTEGVIISNDALRSRIQLIGRISGEPTVEIGYAKGTATAELTDVKHQSVFRVGVVQGTYSDYERVLGSASFISLDEDGQQDSREWQPVGINSSYLKQAGDIAKTLEAGLDASKRSKLGMVVRAFNGGGADAPMVLDFSTWPGAILVVAPALMPSRVTSKETAALLAPALKATVQALRAHATRWDMAADKAQTSWAKAEAVRKAQGFRDRVAAILATVPAGPAIARSEPAAKPAPAPEQPAPEPQANPAPDAEPAERPEPKPAPVKAKRTRINGHATR